MKKIIILTTAVICFTAVFFSFQQSEEQLTPRQTEFLTKYAIYPVEVPKSFSFCFDAVPLNDFDVHERFETELLVNTYWQSQTMLLIKRSKRWFPVIEPILKKNNIPDDFKYLAVAESGLQQVVSSSGATGFWQFLNSTGKKYNLEIDDEVDERYHVEKATEAACKYFTESYGQFQNWALVAASYNMGIEGVKNQLEKQKAKTYWDLLLNTETSRYVFRIMALKEILSSPAKYGFHVSGTDYYKPLNFSVVKIDSSVSDLAQFALENKINYKQLKIANPWLRQNFISNADKKVYEIKILRNNN